MPTPAPRAAAGGCCGAAGGFCGWGDFAVLIFPGVKQWLAGLESSQKRPESSPGRKKRRRIKHEPTSRANLYFCIRCDDGQDINGPRFHARFGIASGNAKEFSCTNKRGALCRRALNFYLINNNRNQITPLITFSGENPRASLQLKCVDHLGLSPAVSESSSAGHKQNKSSQSNQAGSFSLACGKF